jgi:uncharacterized membrane protein SirB2
MGASPLRSQRSTRVRKSNQSVQVRRVMKILPFINFTLLIGIVVFNLFITRAQTKLIMEQQQLINHWRARAVLCETGQTGQVVRR